MFNRPPTHEIPDSPSAVVQMAEALASDIKRPRRYCILDGADTYRLLKAYGRLPKPV